MKDSGVKWIGEIPNYWDIQSIRNLTKEHMTGVWGNEPQGTENDKICLRIADFDFDKIRFKEKEEYTIRNYNATEIFNKTLRYGDLLIEKSGGGEKTPVGRVVLYDLKEPALFANFMECIRLKDNYLFEYAKYVLYSVYTNGVNKLYYNQTTGIQNLNIPNYLREVMVPYPPIEEQQKISNHLNQICNTINNLKVDAENQIKQLIKYKKFVITEAVTKGLDKNIKLKESGIDWIEKIPEHWEIMSLKYVLARPMKYGASESGVAYDENLPRYIRITDITSDGKLKEDGKLSLTENQANGYILDKKCVLFARSGATVGKTFMYKPEYGKAAFAGYLISAVLDEDKMKTEWLKHYTSSNNYWEWVNMIFTQATVQNIGADKYVNLPVTIPPIEEQEEIVEYLDKKCEEIDSIIETKKQQIETLEEYKKSIIYEYVTGKRTV